MFMNLLRPQSRSPDRKDDHKVDLPKTDQQPAAELTRRRSRCLLRRSSGQQKVIQVVPLHVQTKEMIVNDKIIKVAFLLLLSFQIRGVLKQLFYSRPILLELFNSLKRRF